MYSFPYFCCGRVDSFFHSKDDFDPSRHTTPAQASLHSNVTGMVVVSLLQWGLRLVAEGLEVVKETVVGVELVDGLLTNVEAWLAAVAREDVEHAWVLGLDVELAKVPEHTRVVVLELNVEAVQASPVGEASARYPVVALVRVAIPVTMSSQFSSH